MDLVALLRPGSLALSGLLLGGSLVLAQGQPPPKPEAPAPVILPAAPVESGVADCATPAAEAAPPNFGGLWWERPKLSGDWHGFRNELAASGAKFDMSFTQFYQGVTAGGRERGWEFGGKLDYFLNVDGQKLGLWQGFFISAHAETRYGQSVNGQEGLILPSNIAMLFPKPAADVTALTGLKFTQALSENFAVFAGKMNTLDEYRLKFANGKGLDTFMNTSLVFNPILLRTVPYATFGAGFAILHEQEPVFTLTALDPEDRSTTNPLLDPYERGVVLLAEATLPVKLAGRPGHQVFGFVWSSADYLPVDQASYALVPGRGISAQRQEDSWAVYYNFDQYLVMDRCDPRRGWGIFGQTGLADGNPHIIRWFLSGGVGGNSPLPGRGADTFGFGYFYLGLSGDFKTLLNPAVRLEHEHGAELFYNIAVTPWCHLTADIQFVNPAAKGLDTSIIAGLRLKVDF